MATAVTCRSFGIASALALVLSAVLVARPAVSAPLHALPATVRVNVAGLGIVSGRFGSTGTVVATAPDGEVVYRGAATVIARTQVYRAEQARAASGGPRRGALERLRGIDVGELQRVDLTHLSTTGRVLGARVVGSKGSRDIGKDRSRYYFGLRSALFTVTKTGGGEIEGVGYLNADRIRELEALGAKRTDIGYRVEWDDDHEIATFKLSSYIYELPAHFVFAGRGSGHGVGMSQWGMQGMALAGKTYEEILKHYYQGIALTEVVGP